MSPFKKAVKHESKLRMAITGPSGAGKTFTALSIATALAKKEGGRVAFIDTEKGSAAKYANYFDFDVIDLEPPFHPENFVKLIEVAKNNDYPVVVIDSLSHAYNGTGGLLEIVELIAKTKYRGNSYSAWLEGTPIQNSLMNAIVHAGIHIIATMRSKMDYVLVEKNGKMAPQKVGLAPQQRDGVEYEFDLSLDMDLDHNAIVSKTRFIPLDGKVFNKPGIDFAELLIAELKGVELPKSEPTETQNALSQLDIILGYFFNEDKSTEEQQANMKTVLIKVFGEGNGKKIVNFLAITTERRKVAELNAGEISGLLDWLGATEANQYTPSQDKAELARQIAG